MRENDSKLVGGIGEKDSNSNTQWKYQNRIYDSDASSPTIATAFNPNFIIRGGQMEDNTIVYDDYNSKVREDQNTMGTITTNIGNPAPRHGYKLINKDLRIRKLTPKECFRLMGVKDEDTEKIAKHQSDASQYHLAGDSIVTTVLMGIFGELLDVNWEEYYKPKEWWKNEIT